MMLGLFIVHMIVAGQAVPPRYDPTVFASEVGWAEGLTVGELRRRVKDARRWKERLGADGLGYVDLQTDQCDVTFFTARERVSDEPVVTGVTGVKDDQPLEYPALADCYASIRHR